MALTSLIIKQPILAKIDTIVLDASITENHVYTSKVTQFPVETGVTISDHIYNEPDRLTLEGLVTNFPLPLAKPEIYTRAFTSSTQGQLRYSDDAYIKLMAIRNNKALITIVTRLKHYTNMAILSINIPRDHTTQEALKFTIEFQKVFVVSTSTVPASYLGLGVAKTAAAKKTTNAAKAPAAKAQKETGGSILYNMLSSSERSQIAGLAPQ